MHAHPGKLPQIRRNIVGGAIAAGLGMLPQMAVELSTTRLRNLEKDQKASQSDDSPKASIRAPVLNSILSIGEPSYPALPTQICVQVAQSQLRKPVPSSEGQVNMHFYL
jgi:hypothetical protein